MVMASQQIPLGAIRPQNELFKLQVSKTKLCKFYAMNQCRYGEQCSFAHGTQKLEQMPDLKKTSICKDWRRGACPLQSIDCPFAHGRNELRQTEVYVRKGNGIREINVSSNTKSEVNGLGTRNLFNNTKSMGNGSGNHNLFDNTNFESNGFGDQNLFGNTKLHHNLFDNTKLDVDPFEKFSQASTTSGDDPIDLEPIKVNTMDSLTSISTRSSSTLSLNLEPVKMATPPSLQCYGGPSVMLYNLPFKYTKKMLTNEIKESGFDIPRDIVYIDLPAAFNTQLNYGHCLIIFNGTHALNAFMDVFQGKVLRHFNSEEKAIMVVNKSSHNVTVSPPPGIEVDLFKDMEVGKDRLGGDQNPAECRACTGCGHINMVIEHNFCQWCGCSFSNTSSSVSKDLDVGPWQ